MQTYNELLLSVALSYSRVAKETQMMTVALVTGFGEGLPWFIVLILVCANTCQRKKITNNKDAKLD